MKTQEFKQILSEVRSIDGLSSEKAVDVALVLSQEIGKNSRTALMREARLNSNGFNNSNRNGSEPATSKQKYALRKNNVEFSENITKAEASKLLDRVMPKSAGNAEGSSSAPSF